MHTLIGKKSIPCGIQLSSVLEPEVQGPCDRDTASLGVMKDFGGSKFGGPTNEPPSSVYPTLLFFGSYLSPRYAISLSSPHGCDVM